MPHNVEGHSLLLNNQLFGLIHPYLQYWESQSRRISVIRVVVVVRIAINIDIHEVRAITGIRRALPPVVRLNPAANNNHAKTQRHIDYNLMVYKTLKRIISEIIINY